MYEVEFETYFRSLYVECTQLLFAKLCNKCMDSYSYIADIIDTGGILTFVFAKTTLEPNFFNFFVKSITSNDEI